MSKQKVVFCTYPSIYSSIVLKKLLEDNNLEIVAIINSTRVLSQKYGAIRAALKQIQLTGWRYSTYLFMVTDLFAVLSYLPLFTKNKKLKTVSSYARLNNIPIIDTPDINAREVVDFIFSKAPDYLLAAHFNQLVKEPVLGLSGLSCLNIHPSILPSYKGVDPVFYALLHEEKQLGVSLHRMAETFDSGEVLLQKEFSSDQFNNVFSHNCQLFGTGAELAIQAINNKEKDDAQVLGEGNYDSWPSANIVSNLKGKGRKLIDLKKYIFSL